MSNQTLKIFVACGSGIATSTLVQEKVKKFFIEESNIKPVITKGNLNQISSQDGKVDLILVTSNYKKDTKSPIIQVTNLISGVNEEKTKQEILAKGEELAK